MHFSGMEIAFACKLIVAADDDTETNPMSLENVAKEREVYGKSKRKTLSFFYRHRCCCFRIFPIINPPEIARLITRLKCFWSWETCRVLRQTMRDRVRSLDYLRNIKPLPSHSSHNNSNSLFCTSQTKLLLFAQHSTMMLKLQNIDHIDCHKLLFDA